MKPRLLQIIIRHLLILRGRLYFDPDRPLKTIVLLSSGRSGSTLLQNILAVSGGYRVIFEPFHRERNPLLKNWEDRQYIGKNRPGESYLDPARKIITGRLRGRWIDQDNRMTFPKGRLIKDIRANLLAGWLKTKFPSIKLVFLLRNPFIVAASRMRLGWDAELDGFLRQKTLMDNHFSEEREFLQSIGDPFLKQVAYWSVENVVALRELRDHQGVFPVFFENMVADPKSVFMQLFNDLDLPFRQNRINAVMAQPARTAYHSSSAVLMTPTTQQFQEALNILQHFGLDSIYPDYRNLQPQCKSGEVFDISPPGI